MNIELYRDKNLCGLGNYYLEWIAIDGKFCYVHDPDGWTKISDGINVSEKRSSIKKVKDITKKEMFTLLL